MINKYGQVAILASRLVLSGEFSSPVDAWMKTADIIFVDSLSSIHKGCPKAAYLGLCEEGLVKGIDKGSYTRSVKNKNYALKAVSILEEQPDLADKKELWRLVIDGQAKVHNNQMDVVLGLWHEGYITTNTAWTSFHSFGLA